MRVLGEGYGWLWWKMAEGSVRVWLLYDRVALDPGRVWLLPGTLCIAERGGSCHRAFQTDRLTAAAASVLLRVPREALTTVLPLTPPQRAQGVRGERRVHPVPPGVPAPAHERDLHRTCKELASCRSPTRHEESPPRGRPHHGPLSPRLLRTAPKPTAQREAVRLWAEAGSDGAEVLTPPLLPTPSHLTVSPQSGKSAEPSTESARVPHSLRRSSLL